MDQQTTSQFNFSFNDQNDLFDQDDLKNEKRKTVDFQGKNQK